MDENDIFKKLRSSIKFDDGRIKSDPCKLRVLQSKSKSLSQLNFFNTKLCKDTNIETLISAKSEFNKTYHCCQQEKRKSFESEDCKTFRMKNKIFVNGEDIPEPVKTFAQLEALYDSNQLLIKNIVKKKGFEEMTPIQMQAIPAMLHGREILACAPTGSGKTVAFLVPVLSQILKRKSKHKFGLQALIVSPTRELAEQTLRECKEMINIQNQSDGSTKMEDLVCVKMLDKAETKAFTQNGIKQAKSIDLLITTPNRLVYLLQQNPPVISLESVEWLVVDECDKLFEEGPGGRSFRLQLGIIYSSCTNPLVRRAMFSATFAFDVQQWCLLNMDNVLQITIGGKNTAVLSVDQSVQYVGNEQGKLLALQQLIREGFSPPVIIFVQSKNRAKELFAELIYDGVNVDTIHADRTPTQRENTIKSFRRGDTWILICTELLGRGIDFKGVNLVVNYDFPTSAVSYIHRIGRTGRAGKHGKAITFFTDTDRPLLRSIANVIREAGCHVPGYMLQLKKPQKDERKRMSRKEQQRLTIRSAPPDILNPKKQKFAAEKQTKRTRKTKIKNLKHNLTQK